MDHGVGLASDRSLLRPPGGAGYRAWGRPAAEGRHQEEKPGYAATAVGVSHCGAGCSIGDVVAEFSIFALGATIGGLPLLAEYAGDYLAAVALGIVFQYFAIAPLRGLSVGRGLIEATKADVLSLTSFQIGLFGLHGIWRRRQTDRFTPVSA